jgi:glutamate/tyrosine decarboxylase-like PLP-dependent enzyme
MRPILEDAAQRAIRYLETINDRPVATDPASVARAESFDSALPDGPTDAHEALAMLDDIGSPGSMAMGGRRFFGFVIGGALPETIASNWLTTAWDQNAALHRVTPVVAVLERTALRWMLELLRLPPETGAAFVTGATVANLCALAAARHAVLKRAGWDVEADGLFGAPPVTLVCSGDLHPANSKSLGLLGLGRSRIIPVPVDDQGRMRVEAMPPLDGPTIVCCQVGNVNSGACDDVDAICDTASRAGAWVHVDGAFGLWAAAAPSRAYLVRGMERADSWATDAHKWLNVPYDSGVAFVRDPHALQAAMAVTAAYLPTTSPFRNPADFTPELSRRARGVDVWMALRVLGRSGVAELVERCCRHARRFAEGLRAEGFEILNDVVLNQVLVSFGDASTTEATIEAIQRDGTCWCGVTQWQGRTAMRISVSSWATTDEDVELSLAAMLRAAASAKAGATKPAGATVQPAR